MKRIGLISDTHSYIDDHILSHFEECDEIWHAGDVGDLNVMQQLEAIKPVRAVYGNIDDLEIRIKYPLDLRFKLEGVDVWITHIGGYPGRYNKRVRAQMELNPPALFICGHSHILKVMPDKKYNLLHINPGAAGQHGFHQIRTIIRFSLEEGRVKDLEAIELGKRGVISNKKS